MKKRLGYQDGFHLLSFSDTPEFEINRVLRDQQSVEDVLARLMMLKPIDTHTDIVSALKFLSDYVKELPLHTGKQILIFSDDLHEPGADSLYGDKSENLGRIQSIADYIKRNGWKVNIVLFPESSDAPAEKEASNIQRGLLAELAQLLGTEVVEFDGSLDNFQLPAAVVAGSENQNIQDTEATRGETASGSAAESDGEDGGSQAKDSSGGFNQTYLYIFLFILLFVLIFFLVRRLFSSYSEEKPAVRDRERESSLGFSRSEDNSATVLGSYGSEKDDSKSLLSAAKQRSSAKESPYGDYQKPVRDTGLPLKKSEKDTQEKKDSPLTLNRKSSRESEGASVLSAFANRDRGGRDLIVPGSPASSKSEKTAKKPKQAKTSLHGESGQDSIEMRVDFQRNKLGHNMQWFDSGASFSIGEPGVADFEIHSIDVSGVIATVRRKGDNYNFTPEQPEYFPEMKKPLENCLRRPIRVISPDSGFATSILFQRWLSPLDRLNKILHMTDKAGKPDPDLE